MVRRHNSCLLVLMVWWFGCTVFADSRTPRAKPVAVVNGEPISRADFDAAASGVPELAAAAEDSPRRQSLRKELVNLLVDETLLRQFLRKNTAPPARETVNRRMQELAQGLKARGRTLDDYCQETHQTVVQIEAGIVTALLWNAYLDQRLSEPVLRENFECNREYFDGVLLRASHIFLAAPPGKDTKAEAAIVQQLEQIRRQLLEGLDFAEAVKRYSQDPATLASGGDVGLFRPQQPKQNPFVQAALRLKVGQVSEVVRTEFGYHLVKLTDRKPGKPVTFEDAKHEVFLLMAGELRQETISQQRKTAKIEMYLP